MRKAVAILALAAGCLAGAGFAPASAQVALAPAKADPNDPDAVLVDELVVVARERGPAWWTVSNGTTTVYVLGAPSLAPKRTPWDTTVLERRLQGASEVILPFQEVKARLSGSIGTAWNLMRLRAGGPFEDRLDAATRARFVAARSKLGEPAKRYSTSNALAAGIQLHLDYRDRNNLTNADAVKVVKAYARNAKVPVVEHAYDIGKLMGQVIRTSPQAGRACLDAVMEQVEAGPGVTVAAAHAWAAGDVPGALENERTYERCINLVPGAQAYDARSKADEVAAIEQALKKPGHAVAVMPLRPLLAQGGVLDQLRAKGYQVKAPGQS